MAPKVRAELAGVEEGGAIDCDVEAVALEAIEARVADEGNPFEAVAGEALADDGGFGLLIGASMLPPPS